MINMRRAAPILCTPPVIARATLAALATAGIAVTLAVAGPATAGAIPVTMQGDQLCVRTTCIDRTLRVTTYQTQPDSPTAPPSAFYIGR